MKQVFIVCMMFMGITFSNARPHQLALNGMWKFTTNTDFEWGFNQTLDTDLSTITWDSIYVPGNWDTENAYAHYVGKAAYFKQFILPEDFRNQELFVHFEAVNYLSKVYLNGNYLGTHEGGYTPFEFCISDLVNDSLHNELVVIVDNTYARGAWWSWGGISGAVHIQQYKRVKADKFHIAAIPNFDTNMVDFNWSTSFENLQANHDNHVELTIDFGNQQIPNIKQDLSIPKGSFKTTTGNFQIPIEQVKLWHFDSPNLYTATMQVCIDNQKELAQSIRYGIRKIAVEGTQLLLNNEVVRAFGFNRVSDHRAYGNTEPFDLIKRDIDDMKSMGAVFTRIMHTPQSPKLLDYCDEIGMLIIAENPIWGRFDPNAYAQNPIVKQWYKEMIERDFNHPCIVAWSVANEIGIDRPSEQMRMSKEQYRFVSSMLNYIKNNLDSTRLLTYASFTAFRDAANPDNDPAGLCDFISYNSYRDIVKDCQVIHERWPNKAIFISEFGKSIIGEDLSTADLHPSIPIMIEELKTFPYLIGASLWTYNDYRSAYKGTPPSENRTWGVVDVWRNHKQASETIRNLFIPIRSMEVDLLQKHLHIKIEAYGKTDLPNTAIENYTLQIKIDKQIISEDLLQVFKQGDTSYFIDKKLDNKTLKSDYLLVNILSPTGISILCKRIDLKPTISILQEKNEEDNNLLLPPRIQHIEKVLNGYVIGFTVAENDAWFEISYTNKKGQQSIQTALKGSFKISETDDIQAFRIRRFNDGVLSSWSQPYQL